MGRHRSDPMGIARLLLVGLAVLAVLALIVMGALSLFGSLEADPQPTPLSSTSPASAIEPEQAPTVLVRCVRADGCPKVFLKVAGGDVLFDRRMERGEQVSSSDAKIDVVLDDAAAVQVEVNGAAREPGKPGERQEFTVSRD